MKIALAQINTTVGDINGNRDLVVQTMNKVRELDADMVVFPELCLTGYPPRDLLGLHGFVESNLNALHQIAGQTGKLGVVVGFVDLNQKKEGRNFFNSAAFLSEGKVQAVTHKSLLPTYDVFDEERYFKSSDSVQLVKFHGRTIGISICEDAWNSENFWPKPLYATDPIREQVENIAENILLLSD